MADYLEMWKRKHCDDIYQYYDDDGTTCIDSHDVVIHKGPNCNGCPYD